MTDNKKILFCDNSLRNLINFRGDVINSYVADGYSVILVAPQDYDYHPDNSKIKFIQIEMNRSGMNPIRELVYLKKLYLIYKEEQPDYIFLYTIKPNIYGSIAAKLCNIPSTAMIAGLGYVFSSNSIGSIIARALYRFALHFPEHVLVLNKYNFEVMIKKHIVSRNKIILLPGGEGINLDKFI